MANSGKEFTAIVSDMNLVSVNNLTLFKRFPLASIPNSVHYDKAISSMYYCP